MKNQLNSNSSENLFLFFVLIVIIFVIFFIFYFVNFNNLLISSNSSMIEVDKNNLTFEQESLCLNIIEKNKKEACMIKYSNCLSDSCLYDRAVLSQDSNLCMQINSSDLRITCNTIVSHDKLFQSSVLNNNISICDNLIDLPTVESCRNNYYYVQAYNLGNKSLCNNITVEAFKNDCNSK